MKKTIKVALIAVCIITVFLGLAYVASSLLAPGSYVNAEEYEINTDEKTLAQLIAEFKKENPEYVLPEQVGIVDGRKDTSDHWYHVYFYYADKNEIIKTWLRPNGSNKTTFAFVAVNSSLVLGNWKDINKDYSSEENNERKKEFEKRILSRIKQGR